MNREKVQVVYFECMQIQIHSLGLVCLAAKHSCSLKERKNIPVLVSEIWKLPENKLKRVCLWPVYFIHKTFSNKTKLQLQLAISKPKTNSNLQILHFYCCNILLMTNMKKYLPCNCKIVRIFFIYIEMSNHIYDGNNMQYANRIRIWGLFMGSLI